MTGHSCLEYTPLDTGNSWHFDGPGGVRASVAVQGRLRADNAEPLLKAALDGHGLGILADFLTAEHLRAGQLVEVMPGWRPLDTGIHVVHADRAYTPRKIAVLSDFLERRFKNPPWRLS